MCDPFCFVITTSGDTTQTPHHSVSLQREKPTGLHSFFLSFILMIIENRSGVKCVTIFNIFHQNNSMRTLDIPVSNYYLKGSQTVVRKDTPGDEF